MCILSLTITVQVYKQSTRMLLYLKCTVQTIISELILHGVPNSLDRSPPYVHLLEPVLPYCGFLGPLGPETTA